MKLALQFRDKKDGNFYAVGTKYSSTEVVFSLWISCPQSPSAPVRIFQRSLFLLEAQILSG